MKILKSIFVIAALMAVLLHISAAKAQPPRWPEQKANAWYAQQPWLVGSNYTPRSAINQLEMWQDATFDPEKINQELTWATSLGMNTMRVSPHDLPSHPASASFHKPIDRS